jgi:hypothetical protein
VLQFAELEGGHAQVRERQRRLRTFGLGVAAQELTADPLKLLSHVQLRVVEAGLLSGEPEQPALRTFAMLMRRSNSVKVASSFGPPCRVVNARPVSTQPSPECSQSVSSSCLRSLSAATQGQGEEAELKILRSWQGTQELAADPLDLLADTHPAFTRARDGCLIHRTLTGSRNRSSKHVVCGTLTGRYNLASSDLRKVRVQ